MKEQIPPLDLRHQICQRLAKATHFLAATREAIPDIPRDAQAFEHATQAMALAVREIRDAMNFTCVVADDPWLTSFSESVNAMCLALEQPNAVESGDAVVYSHPKKPVKHRS